VRGTSRARCCPHARAVSTPLQASNLRRRRASLSATRLPVARQPSRYTHTAARLRQVALPVAAQALLAPDRGQRVQHAAAARRRRDRALAQAAARLQQQLDAVQRRGQRLACSAQAGTRLGRRRASQLPASQSAAQEATSPPQAHTATEVSQPGEGPGAPIAPDTAPAANSTSGRGSTASAATGRETSSWPQVSRPLPGSACASSKQAAGCFARRERRLGPAGAAHQLTDAYAPLLLRWLGSVSSPSRLEHVAAGAQLRRCRNSKLMCVSCAVHQEGHTALENPMERSIACVC